MQRVEKQSPFPDDSANSEQLRHDEMVFFSNVQGVSHVLMEPAKAAQPPTPVKKANKQSHGIDMDPGPPS